MKILLNLILLTTCFSYSQDKNYKKLVDNLKFVKDMPYQCVPHFKVGCGDDFFWEAVKGKKEIIPYLINKLSDNTKTKAIVPFFGDEYSVGDVAYTALQEIILSIPTYELLGIKKDEVCGDCAYWNFLRKNKKNREKFEINVRNWYEKNKEKLIWVICNNVLTTDSPLDHPNGGHYELK